MPKILFSAVLAGLALPFASQAALVIEVYENNGNTYFAANGTLNLTGVARELIDVGSFLPDSTADNLYDGDLVDSGTLSASIEPNEGAVFMSADIPLPTQMYIYASSQSPAYYGTGDAQFASGYTANSSPNFGLLSDADFLHGILLETDTNETLTFSQIMSFAGLTIADLGISEGTYVWAFSNGETITMNVPGSFVPEPATWAALVGTAALGLALLRRRRPQG